MSDLQDWVYSDLLSDADRVHNAYDDRDHAGILVFQHLAGAAAFTKNQYGIADPSLAVIQSDEIPAGIAFFQTERLNHQQAAVFVMRVADGGNDGSNNFSDDHEFSVP